MENMELERRTEDLAVRAQGLKVADQESLTRASKLLLAGKELERAIKTFFSPLKAKAHAAWKEICDAESKELGKLAPVIASLNRAMADYKAEQQRKRREAELERIRIEQEKKWLEEEALRRAQEAEARAKAAKDEKERQAAQAETDKIIAQAADEEKKIVLASFVPEAPKTNGLAMRENWDFEIVDETAIPREFMCPDELKIRKVVKAMKEKTNIPGIRAFNRPIMQRIGTRSDRMRPS
jgi:hypothetical protein